ncbi:unnamed protein product [Ectocarpus sp. 6 AP-2014]
MFVTYSVPPAPAVRPTYHRGQDLATWRTEGLPGASTSCQGIAGGFFFWPCAKRNMEKKRYCTVRAMGRSMIDKR